MTNPAREKFLPLLSAYVDGELSPAERLAVEAHLAVDETSARDVEDLRTASALTRHALEAQADDVDWHGFSAAVVSGLTPHRLPLLERWRLELAELMTWQRGTLLAGAVGAVLAVAIAIPVTLRFSTPDGYGAARVQVQTVAVEEAARVKPVVMETDEGDAVVWVIDSASPDVAPANQDEPSGKPPLDPDRAREPAAKKGEL
jgi:anti-sigma factor RsiW